ncbi:MAG: hypothetical protein HQ567_04290 [Candidatus Nealsonbacteria bacterium]|nr:hypothetical protein [Candidatus Nealsonbacteria bacterium]
MTKSLPAVAPIHFVEWEERQAANAAIRQGIADINAGQTEPFSDSQDRFREERGLPPRQ